MMTSILSQFETKVIFSSKFCLTFFNQLLLKNGIPRWCIGNLPMKETQVRFSDQEDPLEVKWQPTLAFLPGKSHGQRSLAGYSPWGGKESDVSE